MDRKPVPKLEPAASLIKRLGGAQVVSEGTGVAVSLVHRWTYPRENGGTGGFIPRKRIPVIEELARKRGVDLTAGDFLPMNGEAA